MTAAPDRLGDAAGAGAADGRSGAGALHGRLAAVVQSWFAIVASCSFSGLEAGRTRQNLDQLAERVVGLARREGSAPHEARDVGVELANLRVDITRAIDPMLEALNLRLAGDCPAGLALRSRLATILVEITVGFHERHYAAALEQQMAMHWSLARAAGDAERARRASDARYRVILADAAEGIVLTDPKTDLIVEANPAFQRMFGYTSEELTGKPLHEISSQDRTTVEREIRRTMRDGSNLVTERPSRRKDGTPLTIDASGTMIDGGGRQLLCIIVRDVTERVRVEAQLDRARRSLERSRDEERARLAVVLHDGPVQDLSSLRFRLAETERAVAAGTVPPNLGATLLDIQARLGEITDLLRGEIADLRPPDFGDQGLTAALDRCASALRAEYPWCEISLHIDPSAQALSEAIALCLFRVAHEAMRNSLTHGWAPQIALRVRLRAGLATLRVIDDGRGFNVPLDLTVPSVPGHLGLVGMAERVATLHGRLRVRSRPEKGTVVRAWIPIPEGTADDDDPNADRG